MARIPFPIRVAFAALAWTLAFAAPARAVLLPAGFTVETLPWAFDFPTKIAFLPDGRMLVAEKGGIVYVVSGGTRHSIWVHEDEILNTDDRGLLSVAVDPNYATNRRLYFFYTCDPDSNGIELDNYDEAFCRLARYEMSAADPNQVDESTRTILMGAGWSDGFVSASGTHNNGDLEWGADGTLLVSAGDGAHFEEMDPGGMDPDQFLPGRMDPAEDLGAFRSQWLGSLSGKILRVDPVNGHGLPSNPFWNGNPVAAPSRVWAYGLRNPFRVTRRPGTGSASPSAGDPGQLFVGDVGWSSFEEINVVSAAGANFGWPCFEGVGQQPDYQAATPSACDCSTLGTPENPSLATPPVVSLARANPGLSSPPGNIAATIVGGVFCPAPGYPEPYRDLYYFGDYSRNWILGLSTNASGGAPNVIHFAEEADGPVTFAVDPTTGDLWFASIYTGEIHSVRWVGGTSVEMDATPRLELSAPHPNPTQGGMTMALDLPAAASVEMSVFDALGRLVHHDAPRTAGPGRQLLSWTGRTNEGGAAPAGLYLVSVRAGAETLTRRVARVQ